MKAIEISTSNFTRAFKKLADGIAMADSDLNRDGVIQRFEFTFELFGKTVRLILIHEGFECRSPRSCIKEAFKHGYIIDDEIFLDMLDDRNRSSHVYDEQTSLEIFKRIEQHYFTALNLAEKRFSDYIKNQKKDKKEITRTKVRHCEEPNMYNLGQSILPTKQSPKYHLPTKKKPSLRGV